MKPVAYINVEERKLEWAEPITWHTPTIAQMDKIPLYIIPNTEPVAWTDGKGHYFDKNSFFPVDDLTPLYTHPAKTLIDDAVRYQWLRNEYAHGRETYLAEGIPSGEKLDEYIDEQLRKAQEK
jgi:hypothetical protein